MKFLKNIKNPFNKTYEELIDWQTTLFTENKAVSDFVGMILRMGWCAFIAKLLFHMQETNKITNISTFVLEIVYIQGTGAFFLLYMILASGVYLMVYLFFAIDFMETKKGLHRMSVGVLATISTFSIIGSIALSVNYLADDLIAKSHEVQIISTPKSLPSSTPQ